MKLKSYPKYMGIGKRDRVQRYAQREHRTADDTRLRKNRRGAERQDY